MPLNKSKLSKKNSDSFATLTSVVGTEKKHLNEMVLLSKKIKIEQFFTILHPNYFVDLG